MGSKSVLSVSMLDSLISRSLSDALAYAAGVYAALPLEVADLSTPECALVATKAPVSGVTLRAL